MAGGDWRKRIGSRLASTESETAVKVAWIYRFSLRLCSDLRPRFRLIACYL
ncbi:hypothetical protein SLEP1_g9284 [Rubroshorea leprosula]|uniref:Uncharacterized protein n=1 Tax=Rubroshorea leprosula TaxID=152421 RepID=A0AAV5ICV0_9ROSI|nr:hypothetical protein SLEP1_g9284 [Rubroshorea leprosula]